MYLVASMLPIDAGAATLGEDTERRLRDGGERERERDRKDRETEPGPQRKTLNGCEGAKNREDQGITERDEDGGCVGERGP